MMNETMLELIKKGFSVHIYPSYNYRCSAVITNTELDKSARGYGDCPEKALSNAMLHYIDGHGRIE